MMSLCLWSVLAFAAMLSTELLALRPTPNVKDRHYNFSLVSSPVTHPTTVIQSGTYVPVVIAHLSCQSPPPFLSGPDIINLHDRFNLTCDVRVVSITPDLLKKFPIHDMKIEHSTILPDGTPLDEVLMIYENETATTHYNRPWGGSIDGMEGDYGHKLLLTVTIYARANTCADAGHYKCLGRLKGLSGELTVFGKEIFLQIRNCAQGRK